MTNKDLWEDITSFEALQAAWIKVDTNAGSQGGDGVSRSEFRDDRFARLNQLRADLLSGTYKMRNFVVINFLFVDDCFSRDCDGSEL